MRNTVLPLAFLASVAKALPADSAWENWDAISSSTTKTPTIATTTTRAISSQTTWLDWSKSSSTTAWNDWSKTSPNTPSTTTTRRVSEWSDSDWANWSPSSSSGYDKDNKHPSSGSGRGKNNKGPSSTSGQGHGDSTSSSDNHNWQVGSNPSSNSGSHGGSWSGVGTPKEMGPLDDWFRQPVPSGAAPTATLLPNIHWSQDQTDPDHVKPCDSRQQYYIPSGAHSDTTHDFGWLTTNFTNNAIVLDHSSLYTWTYEASSGSLTLTFKDKATYSLAEETWHTGMIMVFYDGSCGEAMNCYAVCNSLFFNKAAGACSMSTSSARFEDIASYFTFEWGQYVPGRGGKGAHGSKSASTSSIRSTSTSTSTSTGSTSTSPGTVVTTTTTSGTTTTTPTSSTTTSSGSDAITTTTTTTTSGTTTTSSGTTTTTVAPGNYTIGNDGDNDNCTAPVDTVYGLPTACLGQYFDSDLDDSYDYVVLGETDFADFANFLQNLWYTDFDSSDLDEDDYADADAALDIDATNTTRRLTKRLSWSDLNPVNIGKKVVKAVVQALPPVPGLTRPYDIPIIDKTIPLNIPSERKTVKSPWGDQILIKSLAKESSSGAASAKIDLYCVDCGASGTANLAGKIGVSIAGGVDYVKADLNMNLAIGLKLGLDAQAEYKKEINEPLFIVPLSPLSIGIASIGPYLKAGVELDLNLAAKGQVLGGGTLSFSNAQVSLEVTSFSGSASGWTPSFDPVFKAEGEIAASADFGVPISVALGITALTYSADVSLVERPAIVAKAQASAVANLDGAGFVSVDGCTGISAGLSFKNDVYAQFTLPGADPKKYGLFSLPEKSLYNHCIELPAAPVSSTTTAEDDTTSATSTADGTDPEATNTDSTDPAATNTDNNDPAPTPTDETNTDTSSEGGDSLTVKAKRTALPQFSRRQLSTTPASVATSTAADNSVSVSTTSGTATATSTSSSDDFIDTTNDTLANNSTDNKTPYVVPDSNDLNYTRTDGYYLTTLVDSTAKFQAYPCSDGNIHIFGVNETNILASDCQEDFTMYQDDDIGNVAVADGFSRLFVYYPDEMNATGVSRIRVVDTENIPTGAQEIIWILDESKAADGTPFQVYYPIDQDFNTYYAAMCHYTTNVPNKMFLMNDTVKGVSTLLSKDIKYSITGGDVDACYYLPLIDGASYDDATENGGLFAYEDDDEEEDTDSSATITPSATTAAATSTTVATADPTSS